MTAKFITLEGSEGAGKSSLAKRLQIWCLEQNIDVVLTREPGGTALAEAIRTLVLEPDYAPVPAESELLLMFAARFSHMEEVILPALQSNKWVICDRFIDASYAYQVVGRSLSETLFQELSSIVNNKISIDLTILLDVSPVTGLQRSGRNDRFEQEPYEYFDAVRQGYLQLLKRFPERIKWVNAECDADTVFHRSRDLLEALL